MSLEHAVVDRVLRQPASPTVVLTDRQSAFVLPFYFESRLPPQLRVVDWAEPLSTPSVQSARKLVYVHLPRLTALALNWGDHVPRFVASPPNWKLLHEARSPRHADMAITVYEVTSVQDFLAAW